MTQRRSHHPEALQVRIPDGAHAQEFRAAEPQGPLRNPNGAAQFWQVGRLVRMSLQHRFELPHDISPSAYGRLILVVNSPFKATDKRVDEIMLQRAADLRVSYQLRLLFADA
jgi:hypothetical protein